jgi:hypothetical protein
MAFINKTDISCCLIFYSELEGGKHFFNTVKEGDNVTFASDDENERALWVQAVYRATGQTHKPVPPVVQTNKISNTQISRMQGGRLFELVLQFILSFLLIINILCKTVKLV